MDNDCGSILVFGLGLTGLSSTKFLLKKGFKVIIADDNAQQTKEIHQQLSQEFKDKISFIEDITNYPNYNEIKYLVLGAGVPLIFPSAHPIVKIANSLKMKIISDVDILHYYNKEKVFIGITGTNGKSTTTALTHHILRNNKVTAELGGNIGIPAPDLNQNATDFVLEISSYQLDLIKFKFNTSALINITPDHIDRHGSMENYINRKASILDNDDGYKIIAIDNENTANIYSNLLKKNVTNLIPVSRKQILSNGISLIDETFHINTLNRQEKIKVNGLSNLPNLRGDHNQENIVVAFAIALSKGIDPQDIIEEIKTFTSLPHRMELVRTIGRISFINDSKATNPDSTAKSVTCYDNIYLIAGGLAKEDGIDKISNLYHKIKHIFLIGACQGSFAKQLEDSGFSHYTKCNILKDAVFAAYKMSLQDLKNGLPNCNILLAPACASFDQYKNFEERGRDFTNIVSAL